MVKTVKKLQPEAIITVIATTTKRLLLPTNSRAKNTTGLAVEAARSRTKQDHPYKAYWCSKTGVRAIAPIASLSVRPVGHIQIQIRMQNVKSAQVETPIPQIQEVRSKIPLRHNP